MPGWGTGPWGTGPWSGASAFAISGAVAISTRTVRVTLTSEPQHLSSAAPGDALNPSTWTIVRRDTGVAFTVLSIVDSGTTAPSTVFDVTVLEDLAPHLVTHRVSSLTLRSAGGATIGLPNFADFDGVVVASTAPTRTAQIDMRNDPVPTARSVPTVGGTLTITAAGDYGNVTGKDLLRKLIIRRLTTRKGGFKHLPTYGVGLRAKEPLPIADLAKLKADIEREVQKEPEVTAVRARLEMRQHGVLLVTLDVRADLPTGSDTISVRLPPGIV
jgi:hypothetical protein